MAKRFIISQFKCPNVTVTYYCKEVINDKFTYNRYFVEVYYNQIKHRKTIYGGPYSHAVPALYGMQVLKYLDQTKK